MRKAFIIVIPKLYFYRCLIHIKVEEKAYYTLVLYLLKPLCVRPNKVPLALNNPVLSYAADPTIIEIQEMA